MGTPERNTPCPCGSGKKYKHCHGRSTGQSPSETYERLRRLEIEASTRIAQRVGRRYGDKSLAVAWAAFHFSANIPLRESHPEYPFFLRWFPFDWIPEDGAPPAELLMDSNDSRVDPDALRLVAKTLDSPYSFLQVTTVEPGVAFEANDILRKRRWHITERTATQTLHAGEIVYARVVETEGLSIMMGNGSRIIPAAYLPSLISFREEVQEDEPSPKGDLSDDLLLDLEPDMRFLYFDLIDAATKRASDIRNTDGDPLLFHRLRYQVVSFERAFQALRTLEPARTDAELMGAGPPPAAPGSPSALIHWSKRKRGKSSLDTVLQAVFMLSDTTLVVEVNSARRAKRVRKEIDARLGADAQYLGTEITSVEGTMQTAKEYASSPEAAKQDKEEQRLSESPEVQAALKEMMDKHWASWPDIPLPALRGMTPRQAATDPTGRELLESVLLDFESRNLLSASPFNRVDTAKLRRELGM